MSAGDDVGWPTRMTPGRKVGPLVRRAALSGRTSGRRTYEWKSVPCTLTDDPLDVVAG
jgi:hypothetical protein